MKWRMTRNTARQTANRSRYAARSQPPDVRSNRGVRGWGPHHRRLPAISGFGYALRVRGLLSAGSRPASPPWFSVILEYGGLIP